MKHSILMAAFAAAAAFATASQAADFMEQGERIKGRSYSPAVVTEGGRTVWLAGETTIVDLQGKDIKGDFEAQARTVFALLDQTLQRAGGSLKDIVTMTVYLTDARNGAIFSKVRGEMFPDRNFPASAQITVSNLAVPGMQIEIQATAVIGDRCSKASPCIPR
ncbi:RidA family protein [Variovorax saccharolyticus]|uniref:RidA family protein n=1 Tax=Variovorax saccharolyticus TaxID=3053516 RepID=UPI00257590BB|nr:MULTISPECIES: RidA family protein [unclassified Variovorax]MDM0019108.1 RidA family protein [Variovorax sp. J22R187]MDM0026426.1 RidA family protein [Variovorax sp. J31P216]